MFGKIFACIIAQLSIFCLRRLVQGLAWTQMAQDQHIHAISVVSKDILLVNAAAQQRYD